MIAVTFDSLEKKHIDRLLADQVPEERTLEYKEKLPGKTDADKKEFLADVSAMANASGGEIVYGIQEDKGIPSAVPGIHLDDVDAEVNRLENMIRDGIAPRIPGLGFKAVPGFLEGHVLVFRIPKSWSSPHMVLRGDSRFYSRHSTGKYSLDVNQIRSAFLAGSSVVENVRRFRLDRLARIVAAECPVKLPAGAKLILHMLPFSALEPGQSVDLRQLPNLQGELKPPVTSRVNYRFNFDGS